MLSHEIVAALEQRGIHRSTLSLLAVPYVGGYPFLALARRYGVDYGDVLLFAEWWKHGSWKAADEPVGPAPQVEACRRMPRKVVLEVDALMRQPVEARGGLHVL